MYKWQLEKIKSIMYIEYKLFGRTYLITLICCDISLMFYDLSQQPHLSEPATQISFAVMMAGALRHPGSVMGTMTVATWVTKTRGITVVCILSLSLVLPLCQHLSPSPLLHPFLHPHISSSPPFLVHPLVPRHFSSLPSFWCLRHWLIRVHITGEVSCGTLVVGAWHLSLL